MAEDDRVDQRHRIHIRVLQQGIGGADLLLVPNPIARCIEHGKVIPALKLGSDVQGHRFTAVGGSFIAGLAQGEGQAAGGHDLDVLEHLAGLAKVDRRAEATHQADLILPWWAGLLGRGRSAQQHCTQQASSSHSEPFRRNFDWLAEAGSGPTRWPACARSPAPRHTG
ncbi:hypothetical protein D3C73_1186550 [compost metagenome]